MIWRRSSRVQIYDTDASGLIFYGAPGRWFADAEQELYDALGVHWPMMDSQEGQAATTEGPSAPTRSYEVHIDGPLRFRERYDHETWISRVGNTSFSMTHRISVKGEVRVRAVIHRVYVIVAADGSMRPAEVPALFRQAVVATEPVPS